MHGHTNIKDENIPTCLFLPAFFKQNKKFIDVMKSVTLKMFARNVAANFERGKKG